MDSVVNAARKPLRAAYKTDPAKAMVTDHSRPVS